MFVPYMSAPALRTGELQPGDLELIDYSEQMGKSDLCIVDDQAGTHTHACAHARTHARTHTHTCLTAICPGLPRCADTRKVKPIWILLQQETVSGNGISWVICKSAPHPRQLTMPASHHSIIFIGSMPFLPPNQRHHRTEGKLKMSALCCLWLKVDMEGYVESLLMELCLLVSNLFAAHPSHCF